MGNLFSNSKPLVEIVEECDTTGSGNCQGRSTINGKTVQASIIHVDEDFKMSLASRRLGLDEEYYIIKLKKEDVCHGTLNINFNCDIQEGFVNYYEFNQSCIFITILFIISFIYKEDIMKSTFFKKIFK